MNGQETWEMGISTSPYADNFKRHELEMIGNCMDEWIAALQAENLKPGTRDVAALEIIRQSCSGSRPVKL